jgi:hypothetical protein
MAPLANPIPNAAPTPSFHGRPAATLNAKQLRRSCPRPRAHPATRHATHQHLDRQQALRRHGAHDAACHRPAYRADDGVLGHALVPRVPLDQVGGRLLDRPYAKATHIPGKRRQQPQRRPAHPHHASHRAADGSTLLSCKGATQPGRKARSLASVYPSRSGLSNKKARRRSHLRAVGQHTPGNALGLVPRPSLPGYGNGISRSNGIVSFPFR